MVGTESNPHRIPPEITDHIINFITDWHTLLTVALVSRAWIPASRTLAFTRSRAPFGDNANINIMQGKGGSPALFMRLYEHDFSTLRSHLVNITMRVKSAHSRRSDFQWFFRSVVHFKTRLVELDVHWTSGQLGSLKLDSVIVQCKDTLKRLYVHGILCADLRRLAEAVGHCAGLEALGVSAVAMNVNKHKRHLRLRAAEHGQDADTAVPLAVTKTLLLHRDSLGAQDGLVARYLMLGIQEVELGPPQHTRITVSPRQHYSGQHSSRILNRILTYLLPFLFLDLSRYPESSPLYSKYSPGHMDSDALMESESVSLVYPGCESAEDIAQVIADVSTGTSTGTGRYHATVLCWRLSFSLSKPYSEEDALRIIDDALATYLADGEGEGVVLILQPRLHFVTNLEFNMGIGVGVGIDSQSLLERAFPRCFAQNQKGFRVEVDWAPGLRRGYGYGYDLVDEEEELDEQDEDEEWMLTRNDNVRIEWLAEVKRE